MLLVEDTEDNRFMMRRLLEMSGYRVAEATNGAEAVRTAEYEIPEIILMDLSLPIIDGLAATRRIRQLPELKSVPIIAVSAHDTADFHAEALAAGCDAPERRAPLPRPRRPPRCLRRPRSPGRG